MITYQRLTEKELDTFIQMRIRQLREEGATEEIDLVSALLGGEMTRRRIGMRRGSGWQGELS